MSRSRVSSGRARAARRRIEQVRRRQTERGELGGGQVAATAGQIGRYVPEHVGHLQRLAEANATCPHRRRLPAAQPRAMRQVHVRPELAHAAGHQVGVAVELRERVEGGETPGVLAREAPEVEQHAVGERREDTAHAGQVGGGQAGHAGQRLVHPVQQLPLGFVLLVWRAGASHRAGIVRARRRRGAAPAGSRSARAARSAGCRRRCRRHAPAGTPGPAARGADGAGSRARDRSCG